MKGKMSVTRFLSPLILAAGILVGTAPAQKVQGAATFTTLVPFTGAGGSYTGANPFCGVIPGPDGALYGTTTAGGASNQGTVFRLALDGTFKSLFSFDGTNGSGPQAALVLGADGAFRGTTFSGGVSNWGTIFRITTKGVLTNLFSFTGETSPQSGANPSGALTALGDGSFYGTASYGGLNQPSYNGSGYGTIFRLGVDEAVSVSVQFGNTNGAQPTSALVRASDGCLYGTTRWGGPGASAIFPGFGTIFKITPDGTFTNLYTFTGNQDGGFIYAGLVQASDGFLYGGAFNGGDYGLGTLFKISTNGAFTVVHQFTFFESGSPYGGLMEASDGNLYGTTYGYFFSALGSIFRLTPGGQFTTLMFFNGANGSHPDSVLAQADDGNFYGTTAQGGPNGFGTVFRLSLPLPPVIKSVQRSNDALLLSWSAVAGQSYRVQYSTNLSLTNWHNLGNATLATNGVMSATDSGLTDAMRMYRIALLP